MASGESSAVLRHIGTLFDAGSPGALSDGQLLERFRARGDGARSEAAFAVLVARHGPMVLGVCRRALRDPDAAADAFQATFLVLVRKAGSVRVDDSLGRWLYGVSRRVAARARADSARRAAREGPGPVCEPWGEPRGDEGERRELIEAVDEEVARLPEPFRAAVVLCDLGGLTHESAARQLGCPVGTIESRLSRGRKRLREQLARRGLAPSAALPAWLAPPSIPESLSLSTVDATARGSVSATVSTLLEGVILDMTWTKIKAAAWSLGIAALAFGATITAHRLHAQADTPAAAPKSTTAPDPQPDAPDATLRPPPRVRPGDVLLIEVLEALPGRPISGERLVRRDGTISLGFYGELAVAGLTRHEIKTKLVEHLRKDLDDEVLGLFRHDDKTGAPIRVAPVESDRVFVDDSGIDESAPAPDAALQGPMRVRPGDRLIVEVLQAIQGRPIAGERLVRPDGTISLGFYGDLAVAGLTRHEIKATLIEHLRRFLSDSDLGLVRDDPRSGKKVSIAPADSDRVFVDESVDQWTEVSRRRNLKMQATDEKTERILEALEALTRTTDARRRPVPETNQRLDDHDRRLGAIETKLDRLILAIEKLK